jgi:2-keto-3-deoxy-L-rhamnonate aldolase RhmA
MENRTVVPNAYSKRVVLAVSLILAACVMFTGPAAQQRAPRLNQIISRAMQDQPSYFDEHWQMFGIEHNPFMPYQIEKLLADLKPAGAPHPIRTPIVRIAQEGDQDFRTEIKQWLDGGAFGIIIPQVSTADQVRQMVSYMRYPQQKMQTKRPAEPAGHRGWGATRAVKYWGLSEDEYAQKADVWPLNPDGELLAMITLERMDAVKNFKEILAVPGFGGFLIGQVDLAMDLGVGLPAPTEEAQNNPVEQAVVADVIKMCVDYDKAQRAKGSYGPICGTFQGDQATRIKQGIRLFGRGRTK